MIIWKKRCVTLPPPKKTNDEPTFCFSLITSPFSLYRPKVVLGHMQPSSVQTLDECGRPTCALRSHWSRILFSNTDLLILIWIELIHPILYSWIHFLLFCLFESFPSCFTRIQACWMHPFPHQMRVSFLHFFFKYRLWSMDLLLNIFSNCLLTQFSIFYFQKCGRVRCRMWTWSPRSVRQPRHHRPVWWASSSFVWPSWPFAPWSISPSVATLTKGDGGLAPCSANVCHPLRPPRLSNVAIRADTSRLAVFLFLFLFIQTFLYLRFWFFFLLFGLMGGLDQYLCGLFPSLRMCH